jgi:hypothetical protein
VGGQEPCHPLTFSAVALCYHSFSRRHTTKAHFSAPPPHSPPVYLPLPSSSDAVDFFPFLHLSSCAVLLDRSIDERLRGGTPLVATLWRFTHSYSHPHHSTHTPTPPPFAYTLSSLPLPFFSLDKGMATALAVRDALARSSPALLFPSPSGPFSSSSLDYSAPLAPPSSPALLSLPSTAFAPSSSATMTGLSIFGKPNPSLFEVPRPPPPPRLCCAARPRANPLTHPCILFSCRRAHRLHSLAIELIPPHFFVFLL